MSRRLVVSSSAAALALTLIAPTAALADPGNGHGKSGDHGKSTAQGNSAGSAGSSGKAKASNGKATKDKASKGDPAGNNGTIKIDYPAPANSGHANRPHPGCAFQLRMFDFDKDQYGSITFVGQAPTRLGTLLTQPHVLLSDDPAGGGQDADAVYSYTAEQLGLIGRPQAKQGWHVKVSVDAENAPGGAKHKVFWLSCPAAAAPATAGTGTATTSGAATSAATTAGTTSVGRTTAVTGGTTSGAATLGAGSVGATAVGAGGTVTRVTPMTGGSGSAALTATPKRTASSRRGSALPFTGLALGTLLTVALGALAAGALAVRAGRRRTASDL